jgi:3-oxoacyl-[acyl-carrier-protein] synthase II
VLRGPRGRRVVVTGLGVVTPVGIGSESLWHALCARATTGDTAPMGATEDPGPGPAPRTAGRIGRLALTAARLAFEDARRHGGEDDAAEAGIFLGANLDDVNLAGLCRSLRAAGGSLTRDPDWREFARRARENLHPFDYLKALSNMPAAHLAIRYGARAMCCAYMGHGISGAEAIGNAYLAVREGTVAWAVAGGADSWLSPWGAWRRGVLGGSHSRRCRPFGRGRGGPPLGEGAAVAVLEPATAAHARGAHIYAEVAGYAAFLDSRGFPAPGDGAGLARCIEAALAEAGIDGSHVAYLSAHGEGSADGDRLEARALRRVFGTSLPPLHCPKARTGHLGAASGAVEAAATALVISRQQLPEGIRLEDVDPDLDLAPTQPHGSPPPIEWALNVAHHPLGLCAALVFRRAGEPDEARATRP